MGFIYIYIYISTSLDKDMIGSLSVSQKTRKDSWKRRDVNREEEMKLSG